MTKFAPDTSVVVAGLATWHPDHGAARLVLAQRPPAIGHVLVESYSVLTRLPKPRRLSPDLAWTALSRAFESAPTVLPAAKVRTLIASLAALDVSGAATYDALVAATALHAGLRLVSLDHRAQPTYGAIGVEVEYID